MQKLLLFVDKLSTWVGQAFSWFLLVLTLSVSWEVFSRYALDHPHAWAFDAMPCCTDDVHDGRRLHAVEGCPRAWRRTLRLLPALAIVLFMGLMYSTVTAPPVRVETAGIQATGMAGDDSTPAEQAAQDSGGLQAPEAEGGAKGSAPSVAAAPALYFPGDWSLAAEWSL